MLRIDRQNRTLSRLEERAIQEAGLKERYDIQRMIRQSPDAFFHEMGESLMLIGDEIRPAAFVDDRIDLLAIDKQGSSVIIELKRGSDKLHLLQALAYAAMVSKWEKTRFTSELSRSCTQPTEDSEEKIEEFLDEGMESLNKSQRVLLIAEGFEYEVLVTAEWLGEAYSMDIRCYRVKISADGSNEYLSCTCIYPPPEISAHSVRRGKRGESKPARWNNWRDVFADIKNPAVVEYFQKEISDGRESYLRHRALRYRLNDKRRFHVCARRKLAYVWQAGRFENDLEFWRNRIGSGAGVEPVQNGKSLRFFLSSIEDFKKFRDAYDNDLTNVDFLDGDDVPEADEAAGLNGRPD